MTETISVDRDELLYAINTAKGFAAKDSYMEAINLVHVRTDADWLIVEATDRYKVVQIRLDRNGENEVEGSIPLGLVPAVVAHLKSLPAAPAEVELGRDGDSFSVGHIKCPQGEKEFPPVSKLFPDELPEGGRFSLSDQNMKLFSLIKKRSRTDQSVVSIYAQPDCKPVLVTRGENLRALVSAVKHDEPVPYVW